MEEAQDLEAHFQVRKKAETDKETAKIDII